MPRVAKNDRKRWAGLLEGDKVRIVATGKVVEIFKPGPAGFRVRESATVYYWVGEGKTWERL